MHVGSSQLYFQIVILSGLAAKTGVYIKHKIIFILPLISTHIRFSLCMSPIFWLTPKITREESNKKTLWNLGTGEMYHIAKTPDFHAVYLTLRIQRRGLHPTNLPVEASLNL